jgi:Mitochondrial genome maintenance MGM101
LFDLGGFRDPGFIRKFKKKYCVEVWAEHLATKKKKKLWRRKDGDIGMLGFYSEYLLCDEFVELTFQKYFYISS